MCRIATVVALKLWKAKINGAREAYEYNDGMQPLKDALVNAIRELLGKD